MPVTWRGCAASSSAEAKHCAYGQAVTGKWPRVLASRSMNLADLHRLIVQMFVDPATLRLYLMTHYSELGPSLPADSTPFDQYSFRVLELLRARGYIDTDFFIKLVAEHPRQAAAIHRVASTYLGDREAQKLLSGIQPGSTSGATTQTGRQRLRVLFLAANPTSLPLLDLQGEAAAIEKQVHRGTLVGKVDFQSAWAVTADILHEQVLAYDPHIVHFSGHGNSRGELELLDAATEEARPIPIQAFARILTSACKARCVVLNACYSARLAQELALCGVDVVLGMRDEVPDTTALAFSESFYKALAFGKTVRDAVEGARGVIEGRGLAGVELIQINCRPGVDPADLRLP